MSASESGDLATTDSSRLARGLQSFTGSGFAAIDGAQWPDLPAALDQAGLTGRSLFLGAGPAMELAGAWLVPVDPAAKTTDAVLALVGDKPAAVFWRCQAGEAALWRHLRTLNQIEIPRSADTPEAAETPAAPEQDAGAGIEVVFFRHWDPRSLGAILPALDEAQFVRVLGPADELLFCDPRALGGLGTRRAVRSPQLPAPPPGRLRLTQAQIDTLDATMQARSRLRIGSYLRGVAPDQIGHIDDAELDNVVATTSQEARDLGVTGEVGTGLWSYMRVTSTNDLSRETLVHRFMADPTQGGSPDARMQALFDLRTRGLKERG